MLWKCPIYRFRLPVDGTPDECTELKEIVIDVTDSAPIFMKPSGNLKSILKEIFISDSFEKVNNVLEFGAAKMKNIPFLLQQGKTVCAVEFEELSKNHFTKENIKKCKKFKKRYQNILFPNPFISDKKKFDLVLLANVLPVMPVFAERLFVLQLLYDKVKEGKYLLWIAQKEGSYKKPRESGEFNCGDGLWRMERSRLKTFYKYHKPEDLDEMLALCGFELVKRFPGGDDARLYRRTPYNLFSGVLSQLIIRQNIPIDKTIKDPETVKLKIVKPSTTCRAVMPNPDALSIESLYIKKLRSIGKGPENAEVYHRLVSHALARIFRGSLRKMSIKQSISGNTKIIDTIFTNCAEKGFFNNKGNLIKHNYVIVEAKNIEGDLQNQDIDQLNGRFNAYQGNFGILVCRDISNEDAVYRRCKTLLPDHYILFFTDADIIDLLELSKEGNFDEISDFVDEKFRKLLYTA
jgi:hypothetical protein